MSQTVSAPRHKRIAIGIIVIRQLFATQIGKMCHFLPKTWVLPGFELFAPCFPLCGETCEWISLIPVGKHFSRAAEYHPYFYLFLPVQFFSELDDVFKTCDLLRGRITTFSGAVVVDVGCRLGCLADVWIEDPHIR
jgi:hypothetical protein